MKFLVALALSAAAILGVWWLLWHLWLYVLPQLWPTGPVGFVHPGYWLFCAAWTLFCLTSYVLRGGSRGSQ